MKQEFHIDMFYGLRYETADYDNCVKFPIEQAINAIGVGVTEDRETSHIFAIESTGLSFFVSLSNLMKLFVAAVSYGQTYNKLNDYGYVSTCIIQPMSSFLDSFSRFYYDRENKAHNSLRKNLRWFCLCHFRPSFKEPIPFGCNRDIYPTISVPRPQPFFIHHNRDIQSLFLEPITPSNLNEVMSMYSNYILQMNVKDNPPLESVLLDYSAHTGWRRMYESSPTNW